MKTNKNKKSKFMLRIINLAWKNIWRNKVRSGVILGAIVIGLFSGTFLIALIDGWMIGTVKSDIETQLSHVQIHDTTFLANYDINSYFIREDIETKIKQSALPVKTAFRLNLIGMLASPHNAIGVTAKAVIPDEEMQVTDVWKHIADTLGTYLTNDNQNAIVISRKIADKLKVKLRSKIIFTFQNAHGDMQSIAFRVSGIYKTTNGIFDEANVFVRQSDVFHYTGLPLGTVHEAAIMLSDLKTCDIIAPQLKSMFPNMDVQDWGELNPVLKLTLSYTNFMSLIIVGIFLLALSLGIINTMLMAVLERTQELGMLGTIGMSKRKIFSMIMLETIFLTLLGGIVGVILGTITIFPMLENGIDLTPFIQDNFEDWGFSSIIYPALNIQMLVEIVVLVIVAAILSAIYPARKALKLKALDAIKKM
jgi:ABC-type lipoprotein release transport system permease subunit